MVVPVASGTAVSVDFFRLIPFLCYHCRSNAVALAGTGHLIVRSSWTGMTLYATVRVLVTVKQIPLCQEVQSIPLMMRMTSFFFLSNNGSPPMPIWKTPKKPFSVICFRAKPESLHNATGKSLSTVLSREILLHFKLYELDTIEGTTTVHYGAALPVFYKARVVGNRFLMIVRDFPLQPRYG